MLDQSEVAKLPARFLRSWEMIDMIARYGEDIQCREYVPDAFQESSGGDGPDAEVGRVNIYLQRCRGEYTGAWWTFGAGG